MKKKRKAVSVLHDNEVRDAVKQYAKLEIERQRLVNHLEQEVAQVRSKYDKRITQLQQQIDELFAQLQLWAERNRKLFEKKRSIDFRFARLGFRIGKPRLKAVRVKMQQVLELAKQYAPQYVQVKESLKKDAILADRMELEKNGLLEKLCLQVVQDERFYVEVKDEEAV